jgi:hypothetical protein
MNLKDRIQIELQRQDNELLREALEYVDTQAELEALHNTLDAHDLPTDSEALSIALDRAQDDYKALDERFDALSDRYDNLSDIADKYAELSDTLLYKA